MTKTSSMDIAPVAMSRTGRTMPILSSRGLGFQSTKPMLRSPLSALETFTSRLFLFSSKAVTSYSLLRNTPEVVSDEAIALPFRAMSA